MGEAAAATLEVVEGTLETLRVRDREDRWSPGTVKLHVPIDHLQVGGVMLKALRTVSVVGRWPAVSPGVPVRLRGAWRVHTQYGPQFAFDEVEVLEIDSSLAIAVYLEYRLPNIGKVRARRIVETFGVETARVLDTQPERLAEVASISPRMVESIKEAWREYREEYVRQQALVRFGLGLDLRNKVLAKWGPRAIERLEADVFCLMYELGVSFDVADACRVAIGQDHDDPRRVRAAVVREFCEVEGKGNTRTRRADFISRVAIFLQANPDLVVEALARCSVSDEQGWIYSTAAYEAEGTILDFALAGPRGRIARQLVLPAADELPEDGVDPFGGVPLPEDEDGLGAAGEMETQGHVATPSETPSEVAPGSRVEPVYGGANAVCVGCGQHRRDSQWTVCMPCCSRLYCRRCFEAAGSVVAKPGRGLVAPCPGCRSGLLLDVESGGPVRVVEGP